jgi:hypothetical protein
MPYVRDSTIPKAEYKGRVTWAADRVCPCRPCYSPHDCGGYYGMSCVENHNHGCPYPKPETNHILNKRKRCRRCGLYL